MIRKEEWTTSDMDKTEYRHKNEQGIVQAHKNTKYGDET